MKQRLYISIKGTVQGVGFRPFIYRLATESGLSGFVSNSTLGVTIEAEGEKSTLDNFLLRIEKEKPPLATITSFEFSYFDPIGYINFQIKQSDQGDLITTPILPDIATCIDCLDELYNPLNRRYLYPFINCTNCGPRYSIIESLPYDRPNTSMKIFSMCDECRDEYENPLDRRFHAQPIACPVCGPALELWDEKGNIVAEKEDVIDQSIELIKNGNIIALKGLGGFQLLVDGCSTDSVRRLRIRKRREEKPFALMFPDLEQVKNCCHVSYFEERLLISTESPIVLLNRKGDGISGDIRKMPAYQSIAPENPYLGIMLPYTPLHHLLLKKINIPLVATSGNISEDPICIDEHEAVQRLKGIADYYLVHNRPIVRHVDDSIVRIIKGREMVIRRARGYAPLPVVHKLENNNHRSVVAVGPQLKNTVAISNADNIYVSQHIGDLQTEETCAAFTKTISDLNKLYRNEANIIACDGHPDYFSTRHAIKINPNPQYIQHHHAHIASCRIENRVEGNALGVAWDGTGFGLDGTIWGGEFFISSENSFKHIAGLRQFRLLGGDLAVKEPRRSALSVLYEFMGESVFENENNPVSNKFSDEEKRILKTILRKKINCPVTSSIGRLFDAISSLIGVKDNSDYEGQAAMMLEFIADKNIKGIYSFDILNQSVTDNMMSIDWQPMITEILGEMKIGVPPSHISMKFHNTLANMIFKIAKLSGEIKVLLSGGCFQNVLLLNLTIEILQSNGFQVYWHQRIPPNDGGISLGQAVLALNNYNAVFNKEII